jgi:hypothetical protein
LDFSASLNRLPATRQHFYCKSQTIDLFLFFFFISISANQVERGEKFWLLSGDIVEDSGYRSLTTVSIG